MDRFEISTLRSYYGSLLTEKQNEMLRLHYDEDISFGELSEMYKISRQAVLDSIKRGEKALEEMEKALKLREHSENINVLINKAQNALDTKDLAQVQEILNSLKSIMEE